MIDAGFEVALASVGEEAVRMIDSDESTPRAVVTDIRLGSGISGWDVARHAREKHPEISIVYITGDSGADYAAYGVPKSLLVVKPFVGAQLVTAVATLLNEQGGTLASGS